MKIRKITQLTPNTYRKVPVCGDDKEAKQLVSEVVKDLRLDPTDLGGLQSAREVEEIPFQFFTEWKFGVILSTVVWCIMFVVTLFRWVIA